MSAREFLEDSFGLATTAGRPWHIRRVGHIIDPLYDMQVRTRADYRKAKIESQKMRRQKVLLLSIVNPSRSDIFQALIGKLSSRQHDIEVKTKTVEGRGRFENLNILLADVDLNKYDWIAITDDDIDVAEGFLDLFLYFCELRDFRIAMPAHRFGSYLSYEVTKRTWPFLARTTNFVESGPFLLLHKETFPHVIPFPELRYGWGADFHWAWLARQQGWSMGVVDATPLKHLKPVGSNYSREEAIIEGSDYLERSGFLPRRETFSTIENW